MYHTETNPGDGSKIFVEKEPNRKQDQKDVLTARRHTEKRRYARSGSQTYKNPGNIRKSQKNGN
jgi:hypothetical protein